MSDIMSDAQKKQAARNYVAKLSDDEIHRLWEGDQGRFTQAMLDIGVPPHEECPEGFKPGLHPGDWCIHAYVANELARRDME